MTKYVWGALLILFISLSFWFSRTRTSLPVYSPECVNLDSSEGDEVREIQSAISDYLLSMGIRVINQSLQKWNPESDCYYDIIFVLEISGTLPSNVTVSKLNRELNELLGFKIDIEIIENSYLVRVE